ncbi:MAG: oligosaccharide flippase family protein [Candidatus Zixiibacteriota bacterium]
MSIYGLGGVASRAIQFLLLPVYTRVLTTADYGSLELVYIIVGVLEMLYEFMISSG